VMSGGLGCSSVVKCFPSIREALGSIPSTGGKEPDIDVTLFEWGWTGQPMTPQ
jgi:hypothetical protein